jgi:hypothetical protein
VFILISTAGVKVAKELLQDFLIRAQQAALHYMLAAAGNKNNNGLFL